MGSNPIIQYSTYPVDNFGTVVGESPDRLLLSGTVVGENPDYVCWVARLITSPRGNFSFSSPRGQSLLNEQTYSLQLTDPVYQVRQVADKASNNWHHRIWDP